VRSPSTEELLPVWSDWAIQPLPRLADQFPLRPHQFAYRPVGPPRSVRRPLGFLPGLGVGVCVRHTFFFIRRGTGQGSRLTLTGSTPRPAPAERYPGRLPGVSPCDVSFSGRQYLRQVFCFVLCYLGRHRPRPSAGLSFTELTLFLRGYFGRSSAVCNKFQFPSVRSFQCPSRCHRVPFLVLTGTAQRFQRYWPPPFGGVVFGGGVCSLSGRHQLMFTPSMSSFTRKFVSATFFFFPLRRVVCCVFLAFYPFTRGSLFDVERFHFARYTVACDSSTRAFLRQMGGRVLCLLRRTVTTCSLVSWRFFCAPFTLT